MEKEAKEQDFVEDERGERIPESLVKLDVKSLLDVQTFKDIIDLKSKQILTELYKI